MHSTESDRNPLVSIIVCTYNRASVLQKTMESIFLQHYSPVEIIVIDDGSTDDTQKIISGYGNKVRCFFQKNAGIAIARTVGCQMAKGEYIAFQDDDDLMPADRIVKLYYALKKFPSAVLSFGDWAYIDTHGNLTGERSHFRIHRDFTDEIKEPILIEDGYTAILWPKVSPGPPAALFRKTDGELIGWFDDSFFHACEDTDFFARLAKLGPIVYLPEIVCHYRKGHASLMRDDLCATYSRLLLFEKHLTLVGSERNELRRRLQTRMLNTLKTMALLRKNNPAVNGSVPDDYRQRGLSFLNAKDQLSYKWYTRIRLPIRRLIKGPPSG